MIYVLGFRLPVLLSLSHKTDRQTVTQQADNVSTSLGFIASFCSSAPTHTYLLHVNPNPLRLARDAEVKDRRHF